MEKASMEPASSILLNFFDVNTIFNATNPKPQSMGFLGFTELTVKTTAIVSSQQGPKFALRIFPITPLSKIQTLSCARLPTGELQSPSSSNHLLRINDITSKTRQKLALVTSNKKLSLLSLTPL